MILIILSINNFNTHHFVQVKGPTGVSGSLVQRERGISQRFQKKVGKVPRLSPPPF